ncbi:MAG: membrane lipoprotein lipid attachment site-containing protein [Oscillospiraceae bacterium]|nr:membrane lipoprotein lipid attachment site-containing protein [Oscillospiraceae bacterium]
MRKLLLILGMVLVLTGCGSQETLETIADEAIQAVSAQPKQIHVELPEEAALPAMESDSGVLYMCRDYDVSIQTMDGGDLQRTVRAVSGYEIDELTLMQTIEDGCTRSEFVWTASGEAGEQVCRAAVLDDGSYHYVLTATIDAEEALQYQEIWNGMFESFYVS